MPERNAPQHDTNRTARRRWLVVVALVVLCLSLGYIWWHGPAQPDNDSQVKPAQIEQSSPESVSADAGIAGGMAHDDAPGFRIIAEDTPDPERARCHADRRRQLALHLSRQATPATPEDAISTALLRVLASPDPRISASRALQTARQRWPEDLDLAWINLLYCHANASCDRNAALRDVAALDPQNAFTWFNTMQEARQRKDEAAFDQALQRAADARFYDSRLGTVFLHVRPTLVRLPLPASCRSPQLMREMESDLGRAAAAADYADIEAMGLEHAIAMPAFTALSDCKTGDPALIDQRRANCLVLVGRIAEGDTLIEQQVGLAFLLRLIPDGASQTDALRERYRRALWLSANSMRYLQPMPHDYGVRMWSEGEVNLLRSLAIARGVWPPPADWLPDSEDQRNLILGRK